MMTTMMMTIMIEPCARRDQRVALEVMMMMMTTTMTTIEPGARGDLKDQRVALEMLMMTTIMLTTILIKPCP